MITFLVEDGTGIAGATAGISEAEFESYVEAVGASIPSGSNVEAAIIRGTAWVEGRYAHRFSGVRKRDLDQGLSFPRLYATDRAGYAIPENTIPVQYKIAVAEATLRELATAGSLSPDIVPTTTSGGAVKRKKLGPMEIEYTEGSTSGSSVPTFPAIDAAIAPLLAAGTGAGTVLLVRA